MRRRTFLGGLTATLIAARGLAYATASGQRLAEAARPQVGVTTGYDPTWTKLTFPNGEEPKPPAPSELAIYNCSISLRVADLQL